MTSPDDPYAPTGPFKLPDAPPGPPPESRWHHRRQALRDALPTWLAVLAIAFVIGGAASLTLVASPSARHAAARAVRLVHHSTVSKSTLSEQAHRLLPPAVVVRPASAAPVVSLSPPPSPTPKVTPKVTPTPKPTTPKPVRTTPKPTPTTSASPTPTPTVSPSVSPTTSPTLVTTSASTPHPHPTHPHPTRPVSVTTSPVLNTTTADTTSAPPILTPTPPPVTTPVASPAPSTS